MLDSAFDCLGIVVSHLGTLTFVLLIGGLVASGLWIMMRILKTSRLVRLFKQLNPTAPSSVQLRISPSPKFPVIANVAAQDPEMARKFFSAEHLVRWIPFIPKRSLFPSEGQEFLRHRRVVHAALRDEFLPLLNRLAQTSATHLVQTIDSLPNATLTDTYTFFHQQVARSILLFCFGDKAHPDIIRFGLSVNMTGLVFNVFPRSFLRSIPIRSLRRKVALADSFSEQTKILLQRFRSDCPDVQKDTLFYLLFEANQAASGALTDDELISNALGFGIGGNDSTASALTSILFRLAEHPDIQEELRVTPSTKLTQAVIKETLRLHPPFASGISRFADQDICVGGVNIPKDMGVSIPIEQIQRCPAFWGDDAAEFRPSRHLASNAVNPAFMAWGFGKRACVGRGLAEKMISTCLTHILASFKVQFPPGQSASHVQFVSFRITAPRKPLQLSFIKNSN